MNETSLLGVEDLHGKRRGSVPSYTPFLLILLVGLASLSVAYVAPSSAQSSGSIQGAGPLSPSWYDNASGYAVTNETTITQPPGSGIPVLFVLSCDSVYDMKNVIRIIEGHGVMVNEVFPTHVVIGTVPMSGAGDLSYQSGIEEMHYAPVDPLLFNKHGDIARLGAEFWNRKYFGIEVRPELTYRSAVTPGPIVNDVRFVNGTQLGREQIGVSAEVPYGAGFYDTSEYMLGSVAVYIVFPESNGASDPNTETWTQSDIDAVVSEIMLGVSWWSDRNPGARLSFTFVVNVPVTTSTRYEPISRSSSDDYLWIGDVMNNLGYSGYANFYDKVYAANNNVRQSYGTNWAFTIFVANSKNDPDGLFSDGLFAYVHYLGAPFMVMTYDNNGYTIAHMDAVTAHEMGHLFYANDQYNSAGRSCSERSGYLNIENQNSAYPYAGACLSNVDSIMRGDWPPYEAGALDQYARNQVGWRDSDADGIPDIVDLFPQNTLYAYSPDPTSNPTPTYSGLASSRTCYPNSNPQTSHPRHDITINIISSVWFWVDDTNGNTFRPSQLATAADGGFDSAYENYGFTVNPALPPGTYRIATAAWNQQGLGLITWDWLTILSLVTVTSSPTGSGLVLVDGSPITTPQTFAWTIGSSHSLAANSPLTCGAGCQYAWVSWSDGGGRSHTITTPPFSTTYTANYRTQYYLTVNSAYDSPSPTSNWFDAGTPVTASVTSPVSGGTGTQYACAGWTGSGSVPSSGSACSVSFNMNAPSSITWNWKTQYQLMMQVSPSGGGTTSPAEGTYWYDRGSSVPISATANSGYAFSSWSGSGTGSYTGSSNPSSATMNGPIVEAANFAQYVTVTATKTSTATSTSYTYQTTTTTATSFTSTSTSTSTIPTLTTIVLVPLTRTTTVQSTQYLTSIRTTTVTSYTATQTSTSTSVAYTTVTVGPSTMTTTVQTTQVFTSTGSTTVTAYTTTTSTSHTSTTTSTSTVVAYTTVTVLGAAAGPSSPFAYLGFLSLLAVTVGHGVTTRRGWKILKVRSLMGRRCSSN